MLFLIASIFCIVTSYGFFLLQLLLTFGAPFGEYVLGGNYRILPKKMRLISGFFACYFFIAGTVYLSNSNLIGLPVNPMFIRIVLIVNTLFLGYAIFGNAFLTKSKKERYLMTPLSIFGFICSAFVLLNNLKVFS